MTASTSSTQRYSGFTMAIHWLMAALVLGAFATGLEGGDEVIFGAAGAWDRQLHETLGMLVFALMALRLVGRLVSRKPDAVEMPRWMHLLSKALQGVLYLLMIGVPMLGVIGSGSEGHAVELLGGLSFTPSLQVEADLLALHKTMGDAVLWLAGLHAAAALFHHFVLRDRVLSSMLPAGLAAKLPGASAVR